MPWFSRTERPSDEEREAAAVDLDRIRDGGIPLGAEQRLTALAGQRAPFFSSDLSAKEYALARASGLEPLAQVMGSSVVKHGWQGYGWAGYGGGITEMPAFAAPWNLARERAFDRLRQEAAFAGADAVIGIELTVRPFMDDPGNVELVAIGTAVRETTLPAGRGRAHGPRLCALNGQDVDKLRRIGAETRGVVGHTTVVCSALDPWRGQQLSRWWGNTEFVEVTQGVYDARAIAMAEIERQGAALAANDIVIAELSHHIDHHEYESQGATYHFFIIAMHVLATAVRLGAHDPHPAPLATPTMSIDLAR